jgi:hypothetical protein
VRVRLRSRLPPLHVAQLDSDNSGTVNYMEFVDKLSSKFGSMVSPLSRRFLVSLALTTAMGDVELDTK